MPFPSFSDSVFASISLPFSSALLVLVCATSPPLTCSRCFLFALGWDRGLVSMGLLALLLFFFGELFFCFTTPSGGPCSCSCLPSFFLPDLFFDFFRLPSSPSTFSL